MINCNPNVKNDELTRSNATPLFKNTNGRAFEGWASFFPTQDLVDQYLVIDDTDGKAKPWDETSQYKRSVTEKPASGLAIGDFRNHSGEQQPSGARQG
jgi:hypothetical protein